LRDERVRRSSIQAANKTEWRIKGNLSEEKKEPATTEKKVSRRSMLKWSAGLAAAGLAGVGIGYGASELLKPTGIVPSVETVTVTVPLEREVDEQAFVTGSTGHSASRGCPVRAHVRAGRVTWVEPLRLTEDEARGRWKIAAGGKTFQCDPWAPGEAMALALKSRMYNPGRPRYPMKRVGYVPGGTGDVSNRGKGEFVRITWDEAADLVAGEIKRVQEKYGPSGILAWNNTHWTGGFYQHNPPVTRFMRFLPGGCTERQGLSGTWQHWQYGGTFIWGFKWSNGEADMGDVLADTFQNSKLGVFWGTTPCGNESPYGMHSSANWRFWMREAGIRLVSINPLQEDTAAIQCDQWIPIIPGTDVAMALAIANVWIKEGTYDKSYVATHTIGFDKFSDYVLGKKDGPDGMIDRTPEWAEKITGVPAKTITDLAREWGTKPTSLMCYDSGINRAWGGHEWCRIMVALQAMQGLGKPGVNFWHGSIKSTSEPDARRAGFKGLPTIDQVAVNRQPRNPVRQKIDAQCLPEAFLMDFTKNPSLKWRGGISCGSWSDEQSPNYTDPFKDEEYPMPGYSEVHMWFRFGSGGGTGMFGNDCRKYAQAMKSRKIDTIVIQALEMNAEVLFSDIVLPAAGPGERTDIGESTACGYTILYWPQLVAPLGEAKTDWEICSRILERIDLNAKAKYNDGNSADDWQRKMYEGSSAAKALSWEAFKEKGYYSPTLPEYEPDPQLRWYAEKPEGEGLDTPSGKIEFQSKLLTDFFGEHSTVVGDVPKYLVSPHARWSPHAKKYPLQVIANHCKYRGHTKFNTASFLQDLYKYNGYEPVMMNPVDADARGIKEKDIVRIFNDTAGVLCYAQISERIMPGVLWVAWGSWYRPLEPGNPDSVDKGGEYNTLVERAGVHLDEQGRLLRDFVDANGNIYYQQPLCLATQGHSVLAQMEKWSG
jgi:trimethylamine-N-oxide reductase (cytochrome c)